MKELRNWLRETILGPFVRRYLLERLTNEPGNQMWRLCPHGYHQGRWFARLDWGTRGWRLTRKAEVEHKMEAPPQYQVWMGTGQSDPAAEEVKVLCNGDPYFNPWSVPSRHNYLIDMPLPMHDLQTPAEVQRWISDCQAAVARGDNTMPAAPDGYQVTWSIQGEHPRRQFYWTVAKLNDDGVVLVVA